MLYQALNIFAFMRAPLAAQLNIATNCRNRRDRKPDDFFLAGRIRPVGHRLPTT